MNGRGEAIAPGRANLVGVGLIGGSIGAGLRRLGWAVQGHDLDPTRCTRALELGVIDTVGVDPEADLTVVATPVGATASVVAEMLEATTGLVTDVGSVKASIVEQIDDPRFVGGHPMAGSEQEGVDGADPDLFSGAVWVLTPGQSTHDDSLTRVRGVAVALGADVLTLDASEHDQLVAMVSHVPHLTAVTLMEAASARSERHRALLRLAAGGFRDMTRIAGGHPGIWPDICCQNRSAILDGLDEVIERMSLMRELVAGGDRDGLVDVLTSARSARTNLPGRLVPSDHLSELRVPVDDRPGELARITRTAAELDVSIHDLEIAHSAEGRRGVIVLLVDTDEGERLSDRLGGLGYRPSQHPASTVRNS